MRAAVAALRRMSNTVRLLTSNDIGSSKGELGRTSKLQTDIVEGD
jgi:hypothetical protein